MVLRTSCHALIFLGVVHIALARAPYPIRHAEIGPFNEKDYWGSRAQGIAVIHYKKRLSPAIWPDQPTICHGVFVDVKRVVTACSCVSYSGNLKHASNPWYHEMDPAWTVNKVEPDLLLVGVLTDEFLAYANDRLVNKVGVVKVELAKQCSTNYRHNLALITLQAQPKGAKLVWLYSADRVVMKWAIEKAVLGSATGGRCEVLRWANHGKPLKTNSREEEKRARFHDSRQIRFDPDGNQRVLTSQAVNIASWNECLEHVCPQMAPVGIKEKAQDNAECFNLYRVTRYCVTWQQMDSLCYVPQGTPVFCDVGDLHGVFGLLSNQTIWCDPSFNYKNIMFGMDIIMDGLFNILRIRNGPGYDDGWPEYLDIQRTPDDYKLQ